MRFRTENIYQVIDTEAKPADIFKAFTNAELHAAFTGMTAQIEAKEGGQFLSCNGQSFGRIIRMVKNKHLVFCWSHKVLPKDFYTTVDIRIEPMDNGHTRIHFNHIGVPDDKDGWLTDCWRNTYWQPLLEYFDAAALTA